MDSNLYISALQRQPCLLKTNSTRVLVTWLVTLLLIHCPSSYNAPLNNLIGTANICPQIISPQWSNARPNFPIKTFVGGAKFGLVFRLGISYIPLKCHNTMKSRNYFSCGMTHIDLQTRLLLDGFPDVTPCLTCFLLDGFPDVTPCLTCFLLDGFPDVTPSRTSTSASLPYLF